MEDKFTLYDITLNDHITQGQWQLSPNGKSIYSRGKLVAKWGDDGMTPTFADAYIMTQAQYMFEYLQFIDDQLDKLLRKGADALPEIAALRRGIHEDITSFELEWRFLQEDKHND